jgi:phosphoglycerate dehydrogenase-like enzyme
MVARSRIGSKSEGDTKLRVHIQNPPRAPDSLTLERRQLQRALAPVKSLNGRKIEITVDEGGDKVPADLDAEIMITLTKVDLAKARAITPRLKWVQTTFAGVEGMVEGVPRDLRITNASGVHSEKGGEFILAAALMLAYQIPQFVTDKADRTWQPQFGPVLDKHRITLLGVGAIGAAAADRLRKHGCRVTGVTRSGKAKTKLDRIVPLDRLDDVLRETDILVSTLPATPDTEGLIDRKRIKLLPKGAGVVVVGRAAPLDYEAIMDRLEEGSLRGAVLDVFPEEPIRQRDRVWKTPRLIITPHCSVDDHTVYIDRCLEIFVENLERYLGGRKLNNLVDTKQGY